MIRIVHFASAAMIVTGTAAMAQQAGTTSGPAVGTQTTLGTGSQTTATPHQAESLHNGGGSAVKSENQGQAGGTTAAIVPGVAGAESGHTPAPGQRPESK